MRTSLYSSHRLSCIAFALAVIAALYSIGSLVYGPDPIVAQARVATPTSAPAINTAPARDVSIASDASTMQSETDDAAMIEEQLDSDNENQAVEESWSADVLAELAGTRESEAIEFDPAQPPVTNDNVHAIPTGEFAEQILAGETEAAPFDGEAFGFDPDMEQPDKDNAHVEPKLEFADQIRQEDIENTAALSGYEANNESYVPLIEVDDSSAPPTETGASIDPQE